MSNINNNTNIGSSQLCDQPPPPLPSGVSSSITIAVPSLSPSKTGWEREDATPTTPTPFPGTSSSSTAVASSSSHQHTSSLFEFFRGRKASVTKNSISLHQAAAAAAAEAEAAAAAYACSSSSCPSTSTSPLPLMGTPPLISKSRMGPTAPFVPPPQSIRKHSLDTSQFSGHHNNSLHRAQQHERQAATLPAIADSQTTDIIHHDPSPLTPVPLTETNSFPLPLSTVTSPIQQLHGGHHHSIATSLSKVAAAVVCATVGKRRPSVTPITFSELESGLPKESGHECHLPPLPPVPGQHSQRPPMTTQGLDQTELKQHVKTMKSEKTRDEMAMYADRLYFTVLNKDVALDLSTNQISVLQKELDQTRAQAEESKNALTDEVDRVKGQVATMEENFLLWRTKVQNDQMAQQEDYLSKRLLKQNRIEELEDELITSQEEVKRLRTRLLALEYEDGYVGPTSFLPASSDNYNPNNNSNVPSRPLANNKYRDSSVTIEMEPMTVTSHKRRSNDFHIMELKAQTFESQVQELMKVLELERQDRHKDFSELKMRMHAQCSKLEHEVQAAKMESTMYNEMMHEVVTENDDLRKQIKHLQRNSKHQSIHRSNNHGSNDTNNSNNESGTKQGIYNTGMNSSTSSADNSSSSSIGTLGYNNRGNDWYRRRQDDYYGYPSSEFDGAGYDSLYESEDEMEEIAF